MAEQRSPFAGRTAELDALEAIEVPFLTQIDVRCAPEIAQRLGFPLVANTVAGDMARGVLWLGPDEWLVVGLSGGAATMVAELEAALDGTHHAVVDVSQNRAVIELRGRDRHEVLASGCSLDLDPRGGWAPGVCAQTLFAHAPVILQELDGATRVFMRPSFAHYLVDRLSVAR
ncbi:MAG: sarcosine oxidase subunit gamma family protein [Actinomycetota bacterium]